MNKEEFRSYVYHLAEKIGVVQKISSIRVINMKTKVASCSSKGTLTFDLSVLNYPKCEMNKVIIHELLHLRYKNHGVLFKLLLQYYLDETLCNIEK